MDSFVIEMTALGGGICILMIGISIALIPDTKWNKFVSKIL